MGSKYGQGIEVGVRSRSQQKGLRERTCWYLHCDRVTQHVSESGVQGTPHCTVQALELTTRHAIEALESVIAQQGERDEDQYGRVGYGNDGEGAHNGECLCQENVENEGKLWWCGVVWCGVVWRGVVSMSLRVMRE
jgi:hypothetical protein